MARNRPVTLAKAPKLPACTRGSFFARRALALHAPPHPRSLALGRRSNRPHHGSQAPRVFLHPANQAQRKAQETNQACIARREPGSGYVRPTNHTLYVAYVTNSPVVA